MFLPPPAPPPPHTCYIALDCGDPPDDPVNGQVDFTDTTFGSVAMYICAEGFGIVGETTLICQADQTWSGDAPTCGK